MIVAGVDGCKAGWIAVLGRWESGRVIGPVTAVVTHLSEIVRRPDLDGPVAVDMPIGLPDEINGSGRGPEQALRPTLGGRQSSVFSIPSRRAVYTADYAEASRISFETSTPPRKVSKQGHGLFPRIRQVDEMLRADSSLTSRVFETHPEGGFAAMKREPLDHSKKTPKGWRERMDLLNAVGFASDFLDRTVRGAGSDDLLDACAACWTAMRIATRHAISFPETPGRDAHGLPIAIWV